MKVSQVPGLFQVQACCPPVTRQTTPPLPPPLLFLMYTTPHLLCHTPFHYISEVSTATSTNQHNHQNIDVGWLIEEEEVLAVMFIGYQAVYWLSEVWLHTDTGPRFVSKQYNKANRILRHHCYLLLPAYWHRAAGHGNVQWNFVIFERSCVGTSFTWLVKIVSLVVQVE